jgi:hypothetical protein
MNLDIQIKDNFLSKELFDKLKVYSTTLDYGNDLYAADTNNNTTEHAFFSNVIDEKDNLLKQIEKDIIKHFKIGIKRVNKAAFTLANTKEACPHIDIDEFPNEKHLMIYLSGDSKLNSGTGFYSYEQFPKKRIYDLNTAIGCYPNRAVLFRSKDCIHSPLLYTGDSTSPRFAIIIWFEPEIDL